MSSATLRALRGATTCGSDTVDEVTTATQELLRALMERNGLEHDDVVSAIFTTTADLTSTFPATAARGVGFGDVPLLCATEIAVPGSKARCIRVLMHVYSTRERTDLVHVYLRDAQSLRDDLPDSRRAHVVGLGLIGASVARALSAEGWTVTGADNDPGVDEAARREQVVVPGGPDEDTRLVVVATPAGVVAGVAGTWLAKLARPDLVVTDVAGVKSSIVDEVADSRFLGGHPMAGSEQRGLDGARADLFRGCTWVLTPTPATSAATYSELHGILRSIGANVLAVSAADHDRLVALASHVPHLVAGALMNEAAQAAEEDAVLLQLAAGGFRDMTRVAAGDPAIWPDVLFENREAVTDALRGLENRLATLREALSDGSRDVLEDSLRTAARSRRHLPGRALSAENLAYLRVAVSDQPGQLSAVTTAASEMLVNIYDIEIAHGIEGVGGTLLLAVDAHRADEFCDALRTLNFVVARQ